MQDIKWLAVNKASYLEKKAQLAFNKKANIIAFSIILGLNLFLLFR
jgi:hypothetical protein